MNREKSTKIAKLFFIAEAPSFHSNCCGEQRWMPSVRNRCSVVYLNGKRERQVDGRKITPSAQHGKEFRV
jgi:hypothetical protein